MEKENDFTKFTELISSLVLTYNDFFNIDCVDCYIKSIQVVACTDQKEVVSKLDFSE